LACPGRVRRSFVIFHFSLSPPYSPFLCMLTAYLDGLPPDIAPSLWNLTSPCTNFSCSLRLRLFATSGPRLHRRPTVLISLLWFPPFPHGVFGEDLLVLSCTPFPLLSPSRENCPCCFQRLALLPQNSPGWLLLTCSRRRDVFPFGIFPFPPPLSFLSALMVNPPPVFPVKS